jgi:hypothetical protein
MICEIHGMVMTKICELCRIKSLDAEIEQLRYERAAADARAMKLEDRMREALKEKGDDK